MSVTHFADDTRDLQWTPPETCAINHGPDQAWAIPVWQLLTPRVYTKNAYVCACLRVWWQTLHHRQQPRPHLISLLAGVAHTYASIAPRTFIRLNCFCKTFWVRGVRSFQTFTFPSVRRYRWQIYVQMVEFVILQVLMSFCFLTWLQSSYLAAWGFSGI